jgi:hypothetical protein
MALAFICGFETGDLSEIQTLGALSSIQASTVRSGAYSLKAATASNVLITGLAATQSVIRSYVSFTAAPPNPGDEQNFIAENTGAVTRLLVRFGNDLKLNVTDFGATLGLTPLSGATVLSLGIYYRIEVAFDLAAGGAVQVWLNGNLEINTTHSTNVSATPTDNWRLVGMASPSEYFHDDVRIDTGTLTPPGAGQNIARQGVAGTPTYDAWAKVGAATAALCWSDTPFSTATSCTSSTSAAAQTMNVAPFSSSQAGHGSQTVGATDTVNATKFGLVYKRASGSSPLLRRRVNAVNTDSAITASAIDKFVFDSMTAVVPSLLDTMEIGMLKGADAVLTTVEDCWVFVDYTPVGGGGGGNSGGRDLFLLGVG